MAADKRKADALGQNNPTPLGAMPQKKFYRSRAHCNPLSHNDAFEYPLHPTQMDWSSHYPGVDTSISALPSARGAARRGQEIEIIDVGCGFGGLTIALAELFPECLSMGMEIRAKVTEYVRLRIEALRMRRAPSCSAAAVASSAASAAAAAPAAGKPAASEADGEADGESTRTWGETSYQNVSVMKTNAMKYLPNFFRPGQLSKIFFCFPDPHFKTKNHRRRIISTPLLAEYAHVLRVGGLLYTITDVKDLHDWHVARCAAHPLFERLDAAAMEADPAVEAMRESTEEGIKVARNHGIKYSAVFRRVVGPRCCDLWADMPLSAVPDKVDLDAAKGDDELQSKTNVGSWCTRQGRRHTGVGDGTLATRD